VAQWREGGRHSSGGGTSGGGAAGWRDGGRATRAAGLAESQEALHARTSDDSKKRKKKMLLTPKFIAITQHQQNFCNHCRRSKIFHRIHN